LLEARGLSSFDLYKDIKSYQIFHQKNPEAFGHLQIWGLDLDADPVNLTGRQFPPEKIYFDSR
jgi:hypothetical protein